eukprot:gnl/MRDRNA2_/MRDRNA2_17677_c0_seq1.p1 gnl/MRDRNA2_/MRDRNA2_17677_c0~~gnl/MRDRNA2_/MRDRNA2_17677_c0_seq1.p1  ORF type:complete len:717 (-),score=156.47 gnl/MRDRNA2_/MRDRNA2_17677_c0_seq1:199-2349(-)
MPEVIFQVKCVTQVGENVRLVGSTKTIGMWTPSLAVRLTTDKDTYPVWKSNSIVLLEPDVEFKYVVIKDGKDGKDGPSRWENGPNRTLPFSFRSSTSNCGAFIVELEHCFGDARVQKINITDLTPTEPQDLMRYKKGTVSCFDDMLCDETCVLEEAPRRRSETIRPKSERAVSGCGLESLQMYTRYKSDEFHNAIKNQNGKDLCNDILQASPRKSGNDSIIPGSGRNNRVASSDSTEIDLPGPETSASDHDDSLSSQHYDGITTDDARENSPSDSGTDNAPEAPASDCGSARNQGTSEPAPEPSTPPRTRGESGYPAGPGSNTPEKGASPERKAVNEEAESEAVESSHAPKLSPKLNEKMKERAKYTEGSQVADGSYSEDLDGMVRKQSSSHIGDLMSATDPSSWIDQQPGSNSSAIQFRIGSEENMANRPDQIPAADLKLQLCMHTNGHCKPKDTSKDGEDAFFVHDTMPVLGIADGVGDLARYLGSSSRVFSNLLMMYCEGEVQDQCEWHSKNDPLGQPSKTALDIFSKGYEKVSCHGASTALVAFMDSSQHRLGIANLGDSGLMVLRRVDGNLSIVFKTPAQQHSFNLPYQLCQVPTYMKAKLIQEPDQPEDSALFDVKVEDGDMVVVYTDGLSDNLFDDEVLQCLNGLPKEVLKDPKQIAESLVSAAYERSHEEYAETPFAEQARLAGWCEKEARGGKQDDITCIVAWIASQ